MLPELPVLLRRTRVEQLTSLSRSTIYKFIAVGQFPRPIKVGSCSLWLRKDIERWIAAKR